MKYIFNLEAFESLPLSLKPSDYVDFLQFFVNEKPSLRLGFNKQAVYQEMILWCEKNKLSYVVSKDGFMYISKHRFLAWLAKEIDDSTCSHAFLLGKLFGYPTCCSEKIAFIGENRIDEYEKEFLSNNTFIPPFHLINPKGYTNGYSLISHIPCNTTCKQSLRKADKALQIIEKNKANPAFDRWTKHWLKNEYIHQ